MPGKRKRGGDSAIAASPVQPLSAIAAARLKAQTAATPGEDTATKDTAELAPQIQVTVPLPRSPVPEPEDSELDEEPLVVKQNLRLCNWRNDPKNIISDTASELTVKLSKHATVALVGSFQFKVLRGAINVNGANIEVLSRRGQRDEVYTVYAPATHPVSKIRGLDGGNQVQFMNCEEPAPLAQISPMFLDIWTSRLKENDRPYRVVSIGILQMSKRNLTSSPDNPVRC